MWQLDNRTAFAADRAWVRDKDGAEIWLVAVKCTFNILPDGSTALAQPQPPVALMPELTNPDDPQHSSLKVEMDLVRTKTTTDIIVLGHAHAPEGKAVTSIDVGFRVGSVAKVLYVTGDRVWQGGVPSQPQPFIKMPLIYERAFGGADPATIGTPQAQWDVRNPVGTGYASAKSALNGMRLPNIEYVDQRISSWTDQPVPAGLAPIAAHWQPRVALAGTYDDQWQQNRFPLLPEDFDDRHFQCAPQDQQAPQFLLGGEPVVLKNLTLGGGLLQFDLPKVFLGFETSFYTGERIKHERPKLHTVIIEPDFPRVSLVWHTALPCHSKVLKLQSTKITQKRLVKAQPSSPELVEEEA